jgi:hypothetical protein
MYHRLMTFEVISFACAGVQGLLDRSHPSKHRLKRSIQRVPNMLILASPFPRHDYPKRAEAFATLFSRRKFCVAFACSLLTRKTIVFVHHRLPYAHVGLCTRTISFIRTRFVVARVALGSDSHGLLLGRFAPHGAAISLCATCCSTSRALYQPKTSQYMSSTKIKLHGSILVTTSAISSSL